MTSPAPAAPLLQPIGLVNLKPDTLVLPNVKIDDTTPAEHISQVGDDRWYLYPMAQKPTARKSPITFTGIPIAFQEPVKRLLWCMVNLSAPLDKLQRPANYRKRLAPGSIHIVLESGIRPFVRWLQQQGIRRLCDADDAVLRAYGNYVAGQSIKWGEKNKRLRSVIRIWLMADYLPAEDRIAQPPWEGHGTQNLIGPTDWSPENKTRPIHPQTMSGLLVWALRFVRDFSDDIIRATEIRKGMDARGSHRPARPADIAKRDRYLADLRRNAQPLPGYIKKKGDHPVVAKKYVAQNLGVPYEILSRHIIPDDIPIRVGAPIDTPIRGQIHSKPWTPFIDFYEVVKLAGLLAGACLVVVAYLSGMRPEECRALRRGCIRPARPDGDTADGFEIISKTFKGALHPDGTSILGGIIRGHPWAVIEPVNTAISVMERLHPHDLLFPAAVFSNGGSTDYSPSQISTQNTINRLIQWCNETAARHGLSEDIIPPDPEGPVTMRRFRRTLAWFIYRLPAGRISLGIQYGHLESHVTDGYGSRVSAGLRGVFPMEAALARAERLTDAADRLDAGERVSGPAADRYLAAVTEFTHTYRGRFLPPSGYAQLLKNPKLRIFDNGIQPVACCYDATKALCHPGNQRTPNVRHGPNLTHCDSRCGNVARTDAHIADIRAEIGQLKEQRSSPLTPQPMQQAHDQRITKLKNIIDTHELSASSSQPCDQERQ